MLVMPQLYVRSEERRGEERYERCGQTRTRADQ